MNDIYVSLFLQMDDFLCSYTTDDIRILFKQRILQDYGPQQKSENVDEYTDSFTSIATQFVYIILDICKHSDLSEIQLYRMDRYTDSGTTFMFKTKNHEEYYLHLIELTKQEPSMASLLTSIPLKQWKRYIIESDESGKYNDCIILIELKKKPVRKMKKVGKF